MGLYEDLFDFNGDGKVDLTDDLDLIVMTSILSDESKKNNDADDGFLVDLDDLDDLGDLNFDVPAAKPRPIRKNREYHGPLQSTTADIAYTPPVPETLTRDEYRERRGRFVGICFGLLFLAVLLCFIPGAFVWAAIVSYDPRNSVSGFVTAVFVIVGILIIGLILKEIAKNISKSYKDLQTAKAIYLQTAAEQEQARRRKKNQHADNP